MKNRYQKNINGRITSENISSAHVLGMTGEVMKAGNEPESPASDVKKENNKNYEKERCIKRRKSKKTI